MIQDLSEILKPSRFDVDPNAPGATKLFKHWLKARVPKSGVATPSGVGMVNIWGHKLVMGSLGSLGLLRYCHDIGQRGPTTGPRNNFAQVLSITSSGNPFFGERYDFVMKIGISEIDSK